MTCGTTHGDTVLAVSYHELMHACSMHASDLLGQRQRHSIDPNTYSRSEIVLGVGSMECLHGYMDVNLPS